MSAPLLAQQGGGWASCPRRRPGARLRLFCLPYAGGGASIYRNWGEALSGEVELWFVHLPGREHRVAEPPVADLLSLAASAARGLEPFLSMPFALFGHSMGALVAFEIARALRRPGRPPPACLAVSAHPAPHLARVAKPIHALPRPAFLEALRSLDGTPPDVLASSELLELVLPTLRADFRAVETYRFTAGEPLGCPILACGGEDDREVSPAELEPWREHTTGAFALRTFGGGHFYLTGNTRREELCTHLHRAIFGLTGMA